MNRLIALVLLAGFSAVTAGCGSKQGQTDADPTHPLSQLAANKVLVEGLAASFGDPTKVEESANRFLTEGYIQHNPLAPTGRDGFIRYLTQWYKDHPFYEQNRGGEGTQYLKLIAEGDLVVGISKRDLPDPRKPGSTYQAFFFDMFRVENGKLAEHWDDVKICGDGTTSCYLPEN